MFQACLSDEEHKCSECEHVRHVQDASTQHCSADAASKWRERKRPFSFLPLFFHPQKRRPEKLLPQLLAFVTKQPRDVPTLRYLCWSDGESPRRSSVCSVAQRHSERRGRLRSDRKLRSGGTQTLQLYRGGKPSPTSNHTRSINFIDDWLCLCFVCFFFYTFSVSDGSQQLVRT
jgi:hypothetical protein